MKQDNRKAPTLLDPAAPALWNAFGQVCTEAGWTAQGAQGQKRLILDHASEMYSQLRSGAGKKLVLEAGFGPLEGDDDEITVCKVYSIDGRAAYIRKR